MRIKELHLTNIGPFNDAHLEFAADDKPRIILPPGVTREVAEDLRNRTHQIRRALHDFTSAFSVTTRWPLSEIR